MTDQKDLKIETEIAQFAIREFVKKLREYCEASTLEVTMSSMKQTWGGEKQAWALLHHAESLLPPEQTDEVKL
jgi:hypothetical protein